ncbi:MAG: LPS export ABC transporter periplasmic protein LptC, partial [Planctomycetes bacterium]|nr:LPS export ABC transporter periplasmic protein LptC [Planctomycetota bacterium]
GRIKGEEAKYFKDNIYKIASPVVVCMLQKMSGGESVDVGAGEARLTAKRAEFDEKKNKVSLFDSVRFAGPDFEVVSDRVVFNTRDRLIKSETQITMRRFRVGPKGNKQVAMKITGLGMRADLTSQKVEILDDARAELLNVSEDFLADSSPVSEDEQPDAERRVIIEGEGAMTYDHHTHTVEFHEKVNVDASEKRLKTNHLTIILDKSDGKDKFQVTRIVADGDVVFEFPGQTAVGDKMVWENVYQECTLTGDPGELRTPNFRITGKQLSFYRLRSRFQVQGAGQLNWAPKTPKDDKKHGSEEGENGEGDDNSATPLKPDEPVTVTWKKIMTYDAGKEVAHFERDVRARQNGSGINCQKLHLTFGGAQKSIQEIKAEEDVRIDQQVEQEKRSFTCDVATWRATDGVVRLEGKKEKPVSVAFGSQRLTANTVVFDPRTNSLTCPTAGSLAFPESTDTDERAEPTQLLRVEWTKSMKYQRNSPPVAVFSGKVRAHRPGRILSALRIQVDFGEEQTVAKILATGDAELDVQGVREEEEGRKEKKETENADKNEKGNGVTKSVRRWKLNAEKLIGKPLENTLFAEGAGILKLFRENGANDTIAWEKSMMGDFAGSGGKFEGKVDARFGGNRLQCSELSMDFNEKRELRHISCKGGINFESAGKMLWSMQSSSAEAIFGSGGALSQVIAKEKVVVRDAERTLKADLLKLFFSEKDKDGESELSRAVATRGVKVSYEKKDIEARSEKLHYDGKRDLYTLIGTPAKLSKGGVIMTGDRIIMDRLSGRVSIPKGEQPAESTVKEGATSSE